MLIDCIELKNFRNIEKATVDFPQNITSLIGMNAQGKTNLVEAIYLLATSKSFRVQKSREMIMHGKDRCEIKAQFSGEGLPFELKFIIDRKEGKAIYKNGIKIEKLSEFLGLCRMVLFCPENLSLIKDGPSKRRSFIDGAICQIRPYYASLLNEFLKTEAQRSAVLKKLSENKSYADMLDVWNEKLALVAAKIAYFRNDYVKKLIAVLPEEYAHISGKGESIKLHFQSDVFIDGATESEMAEKYIALLKKDVDQDIKYGFTQHGPHKDDIFISINSHPARNFASQGQQRSAVLALKLSEGDISRNETGKSPIYLFDDVLSELDEERRKFITSSLRGKQIIMTGTDEKDFYFTDKKIFVSKGNFNVSKIS